MDSWAYDYHLGDSPSSSASDVDNLNHVSTDNSTGLTKVGEPGSHVITSQNHSGFLRLLNFVSLGIWAIVVSGSCS